jgi:hypothetical protein
MYVVKFLNGGTPYWLAPWGGDPGRTILKKNAKHFKSESAASSALEEAITNNPQRFIGGVCRGGCVVEPAN